MTPLALVERGLERRDAADPKPPWSPDDLARMRSQVGAVPAQIRDLLERTGGFAAGPLEVEFRFEPRDHQGEPLVPSGLRLAEDGLGNHWTLEPRGRPWGPVWFVCHDPASVVVAAPDLAAWLEDVLGDPARLVQNGVTAPPDHLLRAAELRSGRLREDVAGVHDKARVFDAKSAPRGAVGVAAIGPLVRAFRPLRTLVAALACAPASSSTAEASRRGSS